MDFQLTFDIDKLTLKDLATLESLGESASFTKLYEVLKRVVTSPDVDTIPATMLKQVASSLTAAINEAMNPKNSD